MLQEVLMILEKILYLVLLISVGMLAKRLNIISDQGERDLTRLMVDVFWPALIFTSITQTLNPADILDNILLPVFALITCFLGFGFGYLLVRVNKFEGDQKSIFLYHSLINNHVFMVLPFAISIIPQKGAGLLFMHSLGMIMMIWIVGVPIFSGKFNLKKNLKQALTPGLIVTFVSILIVVLGLNKYVPKFAAQTIETTGDATIITSMIVVGSQIYKMGRKALVFNRWNIHLAVLRLVVVPMLLLGLALLLKNYTTISRETLIIFTLVNAMPVSLNSASLAIRFNSSPQLATQGIVFTHLFAIGTVLINVLLIKLLF